MWRGSGQLGTFRLLSPNPPPLPRPSIGLLDPEPEAFPEKYFCRRSSLVFSVPVFDGSAGTVASAVLVPGKTREAEARLAEIMYSKPVMTRSAVIRRVVLARMLGNDIALRPHIALRYRSKLGACLYLYTCMLIEWRNVIGVGIGIRSPSLPESQLMTERA